MDKLTKLYPFLKDSNSHLTFKKCGLLTESKFPENDSNRLSREDKKELYSKHMNSGKFESRAALARHLNVSRAWVSMVLNS